MSTTNKPKDVWCERCGCLMKLRKGKFGEFYGCTGYPTCFNTKNLRQVEEPTFEDHDLGVKYEPPDDDQGT